MVQNKENFHRKGTSTRLKLLSSAYLGVKFSKNPNWTLYFWLNKTQNLLRIINIMMRCSNIARNWSFFSLAPLGCGGRCCCSCCSVWHLHACRRSPCTALHQPAVRAVHKEVELVVVAPFSLPLPLSSSISISLLFPLSLFLFLSISLFRHVSLSPLTNQCSRLMTLAWKSEAHSRAPFSPTPNLAAGSAPSARHCRCSRLLLFSLICPFFAPGLTPTPCGASLALFFTSNFPL